MLSIKGRLNRPDEKMTLESARFDKSNKENTEAREI
jgi:hypothetical protein